MKQRILATLLLVSVLCGLCLSFSGCSAPKVEEVYDRVVELVEASKELNTVFYGAGLPTYPTDSEYAELNHIYFNHTHPGYEFVTPYAKFLTVADIKAAAEKVYSAEYLENVLYVTAFTGHAISDGEEGAFVSPARYTEDSSWIYASTARTEYPVQMRVYDYSSMRISRPSNRRAIYVTIDVYTEDGAADGEERLRLVKAEDGQWYLDSFTG